MKIVVHEQGSAAWLAWRNGGIGSSDAAVIAAHHGMCERASWMRSLNALYQEKVTGIDKVRENIVMKRGKDGEKAARQAFEVLTGITVMPLCAEMDANPRIRASFDGITFDQLATVEIKCPAQAVHNLAKAGDIVSYYVPQVAHQALVAWGPPDLWPEDAVIHFYTYVPETADGALVKVLASTLRDFAIELYEHEVEFLKMVDACTPPCGEEYLLLAQEYLVLDVQIKKMEARCDVLKAAMVALAKERDLKTVQGGGVTLIGAPRKGSIDWARLASEYGVKTDEQERYRKKATTVWQVRTDPKALEHINEPESADEPVTAAA